MNNTHSHIQHTAHKKNPSQDIKNRAQSAELAYAKLIGEPALLPLIICSSHHGSIKQYFVQKREQNKAKSPLYTDYEHANIKPFQEVRKHNTVNLGSQGT